MDEFLDVLLNALPAIIPLLIPPALAWFRNSVWPLVPDRLVPLSLAILGGILGGLAQFLEIEIPVLGTEITAWNAALTGLSAVGVHQVWTKSIPALRKPSGS